MFWVVTDSLRMEPRLGARGGGHEISAHMETISFWVLPFGRL